MFVDPLEQFNIIYLINFYICPYSFPVVCIQDVIATIQMAIWFFFICFMFLFLQFKNPQYFNSKLITDEFRILIFNNFLIKKQIFISLFYTIFFFLVCSNVFGLIPYSVTTTSFFIISFFFSSVSFLSCIIVGFYKNGFRFFSNFLPSGVPFAMGISLGLIEMISYSSRLLSLSIRLFANMMSGHTLIKILLGFSWVLFLYSTPYMIISSTAIILVITFLELMIAFLQSYIFIVLVSIYFNESVHTH